MCKRVYTRFSENLQTLGKLQKQQTQSREEVYADIFRLPILMRSAFNATVHEGDAVSSIGGRIRS